MFRFSFLLFFIFTAGQVIGQDSTFIKIHFKYGSKPGKGFKKTESKYFGGIHGGHVTIEFGDSIVGFSPSGGGSRILAKKSHSNGDYHLESPLKYTFDSTGSKQSTITIPVSKEQLNLIRQKAKTYLDNTPYDYALFGMRCTTAAQELLAIAGVFKKRTKLFNIFYNFYPKKMRKRFYDIAFEKNYEIVYQLGRKERKWENDKRRHREKLH